MFSYRGLFLMVLIFSSARILLADIFVENNKHPYDPQYEHVPRYQVITRYQPDQYLGQQLSNQQWMQYGSPMNSYYTIYPYYGMYYGDQGQFLNLVGFPLFHRYHYRHPSYHHYPHYPTKHLHYTKIGGHGYTRPSVYVHQSNPLTVHYRYRRSEKTDPTSIESNKSAVITNDDDVAAKSPVSETKHSTVIDPALPENEPTDTSNKHVTNRQVRNKRVITNPFLFGLYPEKMHTGRQIDGPLLQKENTLEPHDEQLPKTIADLKITQQTKEKQEQEVTLPNINHKTPHLTNIEPTENVEQSSSLTSAPSQRLPKIELTPYTTYDNYDSGCRNTMVNHWPMTSVKLYPTMPYESKYWLKYDYPTKYNSEGEIQVNPVVWEKYTPTYQQKVNQESNKEYSQEITNIDATDKATSGKDGNTVHIPCPNCKPIPESTRAPTANNALPGEGVVTATPTPCITHKNNEEQLRINEMIYSSYFDRIYTPLQTQVSHDNTNYNLYYLDEYPDGNPDERLDDEVTRSDFNEQINPAYPTPVSSFYDYVLNTDLSASSNPAYTVPVLPVTPQMQWQYFDAYYYPIKRTYNPQVYNYYYDPTVPTNRNVPS